VGAAALSRRERVSLLVQQKLSWLLSPLWIPLLIALVRLRYGWQIENVRETRRTYRSLRGASSTPLLVCANHLTLVDSFLVGSALGSWWWYVLHFPSLPWNTPERVNFGRTRLMRALVYLMKCVPVERGGDRREIARVLARITYLMARGEVGLIFPEAGRSRTGRVDVEATTYGVGRIVRALPDCRVLCVYLRGEHQESWSDLPAPGERFHVQLKAIEPKTDRGGMRGSLEISRQILACLDEVERRHFDGRQ
jgi:1-acyl-sn-glycerol-3-phosphate acyltransferase